MKRAGPASDVDISDSYPAAGSKRSVRDRLGGNIDSSLLRGSESNNKRYGFRNFTVLFAASHNLALQCRCLCNGYLSNILYFLVDDDVFIAFILYGACKLDPLF